MNRSKRKLARFWAGGLLSVVGFFGASCGVVTPVYGVQPPYGPIGECRTDADCSQRGASWYCEESSETCQERDAGAAPDASK